MSAKYTVKTLTSSDFSQFVAIDTPGGNLSLKIKSRAQQITLNPNIIKVKIYKVTFRVFTYYFLLIFILFFVFSTSNLFGFKVICSALLFIFLPSCNKFGTSC
jgi:hypothetical protein